MRVAVIQPNYIPWKGYFDVIASVDKFILLDDVQYTTRDWRNRNKLKTSNGSIWITVPVIHKSRQQKICESMIDESRDWRSIHIKTFDFYYRSCENFEFARQLMGDCLSVRDSTIAELNEHAIRCVAQVLQIRTPILKSSDLNITGNKADKLIGLVKAVGGQTYVSGPAAKSYIQANEFAENELTLEYFEYKIIEYKQQWGAFDPYVSVLDLIANCGNGAKDYLNVSRNTL